MKQAEKQRFSACCLFISGNDRIETGFGMKRRRFVYK
jgi:hypothetical protein